MFRKTLLVSLLGSIMTAAMATDLPNIHILATGGTIAGTSASSTQVSHYQAGQLGIQTLIDAVPQIKSFANVSGEQICKVGSQDMTDALLLKLAKRCNELLDKPEVDGIVITHGTDTMEETAFFLNLTVHSNKPVVLVGSMRPATALSADGPLNLYHAVKLSADANAAGRGVLVALNDAICGARDVTKTHTTSVATFTSHDFGVLGYMVNGENQFFTRSLKPHTTESQFNISHLNKLPRVDIIASHVNADGALVDAAVNVGAKGLVFAGTGNGSISKKEIASIKKAGKHGVVTVRASRTGSGFVTFDSDWDPLGMVYSGTLSPQKARILLQLAMTQTNDLEEIQKIFNTY